MELVSIITIIEEVLQGRPDPVQNLTITFGRVESGAPSVMVRAGGESVVTSKTIIMDRLCALSDGTYVSHVIQNCIKDVIEEVKKQPIKPYKKKE